MRYVLFATMKGAICDRSPILIKDVFEIEIEGAPEGAVAIFRNGDTSYYEKIIDGRCSVPASAMIGTVTVGVKLITDTVIGWECEGLQGTLLEDGQVLVAPNDNDLPEEFVGLMIENQQIREELKSLKNMIHAVQARIDEMMEGWALV